MKIIPFLFIPLLFVFANCASKKNSLIVDPKIPVIEKKANEKLRLDAAELDTFPMQCDLITILSVSINDNIMEIEVGYSGGCEKHLFSLKGSRFISKSLPPIRRVKLIHKASKDGCKKYIIQKLEIDITELAYKKVSGSQIILKLDGWKNKIIYTFS